jgi:hypothetical protein
VEVNVLILIEKTIEIISTANKIWPLVTWDRILEWFDMFKSVELTSGEKNKVGSKVHVVNELADTKNDLDVEITESANSGEGTYAWKTVGGNMAAAGAFYLKLEGNKTCLWRLKNTNCPMDQSTQRIRKKLQQKVHATQKNQLNSLAKMSNALKHYLQKSAIFSI